MSTLDRPLTQAELMERWRIPTEGRSARAAREDLYRRMAAGGLLRAEERAAKRGGNDVR